MHFRLFRRNFAEIFDATSCARAFSHSFSSPPLPPFYLFLSLPSLLIFCCLLLSLSFSISLSLSSLFFKPPFLLRRCLFLFFSHQSLFLSSFPTHFLSPSHPPCLFSVVVSVSFPLFFSLAVFLCLFLSLFLRRHHVHRMFRGRVQ